MKTSPNKLTFHEDGSFSIRINGNWRYNIKKITKDEYFALPSDFRSKIVKHEYNTGQPIVADSRVIISKK